MGIIRTPVRHTDNTVQLYRTENQQHDLQRPDGRARLLVLHVRLQDVEQRLAVARQVVVVLPLQVGKLERMAFDPVPQGALEGAQQNDLAGLLDQPELLDDLCNSIRTYTFIV